MARWPVGHLVQLLGDCQPECCLVGRLTAIGRRLTAIGSGQQRNVKLSDEADRYFKEKCCTVELHPTPKAIQVWNQAEGKTIAMFHVTC